MNPIARFFALESHLDAGEKQGNIPPAKALYRDYWRVAWPTALEGIFLNLILLADLVMVGSLGIAQAAAIGIVSQPKMLMQMFGKALGTGVTAVTARRKGARDYLSLNSCIKQSLALTVLVYAVLASLGYTYREEILRLMGANDEYIGYALVYFTYLIGALFFKAMSAILTAVQIGIGQTKIILQASVTGNLVNVCLNYVLIFGTFGFPRMEIKGAAIATIIGEAVIFLVLLYAVLRHPQEGVDLRGQGTFAFERKTLTPVLAVGTNSFLEQIFERMGLLVFARLIAELGTVAVGTHHYCIILWDLYYYFGLGMSTASASFAGRETPRPRASLYESGAKVGAYRLSRRRRRAPAAARDNFFRNDCRRGCRRARCRHHRHCRRSHRAADAGARGDAARGGGQPLHRAVFALCQRDSAFLHRICFSFSPRDGALWDMGRAPDRRGAQDALDRVPHRQRHLADQRALRWEPVPP